MIHSYSYTIAIVLKDVNNNFIVEKTLWNFRSYHVTFNGYILHHNWYNATTTVHWILWWYEPTGEQKHVWSEWLQHFLDRTNIQRDMCSTMGKKFNVLGSLGVHNAFHRCCLPLYQYWELWRMRSASKQNSVI